MLVLIRRGRSCSARSFAALSNGLALIVRQEETLIAPCNFVVLPLTFLSTVFMQRRT